MFLSYCRRERQSLDTNDSFKKNAEGEAIHLKNHQLDNLSYGTSERSQKTCKRANISIVKSEMRFYLGITRIEGFKLI